MSWVFLIGAGLAEMMAVFWMGKSKGYQIFKWSVLSVGTFAFKFLFIVAFARDAPARIGLFDLGRDWSGRRGRARDAVLERVPGPLAHLLPTAYYRKCHRIESCRVTRISFEIKTGN